MAVRMTRGGVEESSITLVPRGGIANGGSGRFRQINQIRASIEYTKLSGISILSSVSIETIATIVFRRTWTLTRIWAPFLGHQLCFASERPRQTRNHYAIVEPGDCLLQVLWELGSTLVAYNPLGCRVRWPVRFRSVDENAF